MAKWPYNTGAWRRLRLEHLQREPLCRMCEARGVVRSGSHVDHIKAHKGDNALAFDPGNLQTLCVTCHNAVKQALEKGGSLRGCGPDGRPFDPNHWWNR